MRDETRQLVRGTDLSEWPFHKLARARQLGKELHRAVRNHRASIANETRVEITDEGHTITMFANLDPAPPTTEWSLLFADAVHNYRTALDALAWELVHLDGAEPTPANARKVYFPICADEAAWRKQVTGPLSTAPEFIIHRLHGLQPYLVEPVDMGIGIILNQMDIDDKHKAQLQVAYSARDKTSFMWSFRYLEQNPIPSGRPQPEWLAGDTFLKHGDPIIRFRSEHVVTEAKLTRLPLALVTGLRGKPMGAFELLNLIDEQVQGTLFMVCTGGYSADAGQFAPVDN